MTIQKIVKAKIINPTNRKIDILEREYNNFQESLHGNIMPLYSATQQQAERLLDKIKKPKHKHYPLILRKDVIRLAKRVDTKLTKYWFKIPVNGIHGGIWVALIPHIDLPDNISLGEAKVIKKNDEWFVYLTIQKKVDNPTPNTSNILALDLGEVYMTTSVEFVNNEFSNLKFWGKQVRGIRRHYAWLRKRLGNKKLLKTIKKIKHTENRKVNAILHQISREIVNRAKEIGATIIIGDLKGIRQSAKGKGKRFNRIVSSMPCYKLTQFVSYKAQWDNVPMIKISERGTSKTCHRCGGQGIRRTQALFYCPHCNLLYSADGNGVKNIAFRGYSAICGISGLPLAQPLTQAA